MDHIQQSFSVSFNYHVYFTENLFGKTNDRLRVFFKTGSDPDVKQKIFFVIDEDVVLNHPDLLKEIDSYFQSIEDCVLVKEKLILKGGENAKNDLISFDKIVEAINKNEIDRHSYVIGIGGGSILDVVGFAAAVSHRGIKHIRIPTTVLSQNDSGVGVKNGINYAGKKNFLGTFAPPVAVFNDLQFLTTLSDRHWLSGISEAIKVALVKDASFFKWIEENANALSKRDMDTMRYLIKRCAELHLKHIASGDPFEKGSSRPLDFGHWSAHKLEQLSNFEVLHGEAVAIGIALDSMYSQLCGKLSSTACDRIIHLLIELGLPVTNDLIGNVETDNPILKGLEEFREHLGGKLTIMLLKDIGIGEEVHEMNSSLIIEASAGIQKYVHK